MTPGLIDSHTHFLGMGYSLTHLQLTDARTIADITKGLKDYITKRRVAKGKWVQGRQWDDQNLKERRYPTRHDLDPASPDNPVALTRICGHMIILNTRALEACGINRDTSNPPGGVVDKDERGEPTGVLRDARGLVTPHIPPPTHEELRQGIRDAVALAHRLGCTDITDCSRPDESAPHLSTKPYTDAHAENDLHLRCHVMTFYPREWSGDKWLTLGTLKIGIDGSAGAQTALMYEPYTNNPATRGVYVGDQERNKRVVAEQHAKGGQISIHAIGDRACTEAINRIEEALKKPRRDHRYRIEHFEYPTDADIERAKKLGIIASMQPNFVGEWGWPGGMYDSRVGPERMARGNPYRRLLDLGFHMPFGSDGMPFHPLYGIWSAVNHPQPKSRITVEEAVRCFTLEGAYVTREESIKGTIEPGKLADIAIFDGDLTGDWFKLKNADPATVERTKSEIKRKCAWMTILDGEIVHKA
ncbi:TPA: amidohydrolase [Candidatus Bathyarchaeota archaeon]|nr:amidohydrolase [Candidatus Bathyarchaeota archaeon]